MLKMSKNVYVTVYTAIKKTKTAIKQVLKLKDSKKHANIKQSKLLLMITKSKN